MSQAYAFSQGASDLQYLQNHKRIYLWSEMGNLTAQQRSHPLVYRLETVHPKTETPSLKSCCRRRYIRQRHPDSHQPFRTASSPLGQSPSGATERDSRRCECIFCVFSLSGSFNCLADGNSETPGTVRVLFQNCPSGIRRVAWTGSTTSTEALHESAAVGFWSKLIFTMNTSISRSNNDPPVLVLNPIDLLRFRWRCVSRPHSLNRMPGLLQCWFV